MKADRPLADQPHYGEHLGDADYWAPYVNEALQLAELPIDELEAPFVGSFPTFLVGDVVVKLFGPGFDGAECFSAEVAMHKLLATHPEVPAPAAIATGQLFDGDPAWPFLITQRAGGIAVRDQPATPAVAEQLGAVVAALHKLTPPVEVADADFIAELRRSATERLTRLGFPPRLVEQVPAYLADALAPTTLIHADLTNDHVFVMGHALETIIDWGDAAIADPYYEFVPVFLDALDRRRVLFGRFLDGYGMKRDDHFLRAALQAVLSFEFNAIKRVHQIVDLDQVSSLDELAERLFG